MFYGSGPSDEMQHSKSLILADVTSGGFAVSCPEEKLRGGSVLPCKEPVPGFAGKTRNFLGSGE
jgi:hypothetical protein